MTAAKKPSSADADVKEKKQIERQAMPDLKPGMTVKVYQKITETGPKGDKERVQMYEGIIISLRHGKQSGATFTVRKVSDGIGVEKIFPLHSPTIVKVEPVKQAKVSRAKLYYLRDYKKRLKETRLTAK